MNMVDYIVLAYFLALGALVVLFIRWVFSH